MAPKSTVKSDLWGSFDQAQLRLLLKSMTACLRRASFVALKGGENAWFTSTEVGHFVMLQRLSRAFSGWSTNRSGSALWDIVDQLVKYKHVFSVPHHPEFITSYILSQLGLSQGRSLEEINEDRE